MKTYSSSWTLHYELQPHFQNVYWMNAMTWSIGNPSPKCSIRANRETMTTEIRTNETVTLYPDMSGSDDISANAVMMQLFLSSKRNIMDEKTTYRLHNKLKAERRKK